MQRTSRAAAWLAVLAIVAVIACTGDVSGPGSAAASSSPGPGSGTPAPSTATLDLDALQRALDARRTTYGAFGAVAAVEVRGERVILVSGDADEHGTALQPTDRFRIASITKPIVATLVLDAVAQGKLSLDDRVAERLPGLIRAQPPITIRQILDHTSGVFDEGNEGDMTGDMDRIKDPELRHEARDIAERYVAGEKVIVPDRVIVALAETHDRYDRPGVAFHYSNPNYQIAAMVVEKVSGKPLAELLEDRIAESLGLERTTVAPPDIASPEMRGYQIDSDGARRDVTDDLSAFGNGGNGGVISNADELLTVMQSIVSGRLLPAQLVSAMKTPTIGTYGLGLAQYDLSCGTFYGHDGLVNGTKSVALVNDDGTAGIVIAFNLYTGTEPGLSVLADEMICPSLG
jgi:D-alanyl-D-alanine carboxypeptidase